jgi:hypothetical protein
MILAYCVWNVQYILRYLCIVFEMFSTYYNTCVLCLKCPVHITILAYCVRVCRVDIWPSSLLCMCDIPVQCIRMDILLACCRSLLLVLWSVLERWVCTRAICWGDIYTLDEVTEGWRKLHNEELKIRTFDQFCSCELKQNSMGGTYRMRRRGGKFVRMVGHKLEGGHLGNPHIGGRIILNWILKKAICEDVNWIQLAHRLIPSGMCSKHSTP